MGVRTSVCLGHLCFPSTWVRTGTSTQLVLRVLSDEWGAPPRAFGTESTRLACYLPAVVLHGCQPRMVQPCQCDKSQLQMEQTQERPQQKKGKKQRPLKHKLWSPAYRHAACLWSNQWQKLFLNWPLFYFFFFWLLFFINLLTIY